MNTYPSPFLAPLLLLLLLAAPPAGRPAAAAAAAATTGGAAAARGAADAMRDRAALEQLAAQLREGVREDPGDAVKQLELAATLHHLNHLSPDGGLRVPEAEAAYRAALAAIGGADDADEASQAEVRASVAGNLGALLLSGGRPQEAVDELRAALALAERRRLPPHQRSGLLFNLGKSLSSLGRLQEADEAYVEAAAAAFGRDLSSYTKATAAVRRLEPAAAAAAAAVARAACAHWSTQLGLGFLSACAEGGDAEEEQQPEGHGGQQWIEQASRTELVWLLFALHKYSHANKRYGAAWRHLDLANRLMASQTPYSPDFDRSNLQLIKQIFRAPLESSGLKDRSAIFLVGMPRSGSTLVEQMLASHSQVFAAGEDTALAPMTPEINSALAAPPPPGAGGHAKVLRRLGREYLRRMRALAPPGRWPEKRGGGSGGGGGGGPPRIVDKMLRNLWLVGYVQMLLPRACVVHVARHPMDVALSCYAQPFGYSAASLAWAWDLGAIAGQLEMTWELAEHWASQLPGRVHTVLYEDLVENPEAVARELLGACGMGWEPGVLRFHDTQRAVHTASMVQVRQPLYQSAVGRWRVYGEHLKGLQRRLAPLIKAYEARLQRQLEARRAAVGDGPSGGGGGAAAEAGVEAAAVAGESKPTAQWRERKEGGSARGKEEL